MTYVQIATQILSRAEMKSIGIEAVEVVNSIHFTIFSIGIQFWHIFISPLTNSKTMSFCTQILNTWMTKVFGLSKYVQNANKKL